MVRGNAYKQTKDKSNGSIYFQSKKFTKRDFLHDGSKFTYSTKCIEWISKRSRNAVEDGGTFFFSQLYFRECVTYVVKKQHSFYFSQRIFGKGGN